MSKEIKEILDKYAPRLDPTQPDFIKDYTYVVPFIIDEYLDDTLFFDELRKDTYELLRAYLQKSGRYQKHENEILDDLNNFFEESLNKILSLLFIYAQKNYDQNPLVYLEEEAKQIISVAFDYAPVFLLYSIIDDIEIHLSSNIKVAEERKRVLDQIADIRSFLDGVGNLNPQSSLKGFMGVPLYQHKSDILSRWNFLTTTISKDKIQRLQATLRKKGYINELSSLAQNRFLTAHTRYNISNYLKLEFNRNIPILPKDVKDHREESFRVKHDMRVIVIYLFYMAHESQKKSMQPEDLNFPKQTKHIFDKIAQMTKHHTDKHIFPPYSISSTPSGIKTRILQFFQHEELYG